MTGVAARHGARFRKASRAAPLLSLSLSLSLSIYLSIYPSISLSLSAGCPVIFFPRPLCPATSTEHREVTGEWYILFFFLRLCATTHPTPRPPPGFSLFSPRSSLSPSPQPPAPPPPPPPPPPPHSLSFGRQFLFFSLSLYLSIFPFRSFFRMNARACTSLGRCTERPARWASALIGDAASRDGIEHLTK